MTEPRSDLETAVSARPSLRSVLGVRNFRLLWIGEAISMLGDQFYFIALPWLVLQLTGDPLAVGTVLALTGIPRALFMLVGGALTDRFSSRSIMLASNLFRLVLVTLLAALTITGLIQLWMLYIFALFFGLADAFFFPAQSSIVPRLLRPEQLQIGNSITQGTAQLSLFAGPVAAGLLIALLGGNRAADAPPDLRGIGLAFAFDAVSFLLSAITLWLMEPDRKAERAEAGPAQGVLAAIREGLLYVWRDTTLRAFFIVVAGINVLINGPFAVGIPVLADQRLPEGAAAFGIIMSTFGAGALGGMLLAGALPKPPTRYRGAVLLAVISVMGFGFALYGVMSSTLLIVVVSLVLGMVNGYVGIIFMTWLQTRVPSALMGRVMSLLMFASLGLNPVSNAVAGVVSSVSLTGLFVGAGLLMAALSLGAILNPHVRAMEEPAVGVKVSSVAEGVVP